MDILPAQVSLVPCERLFLSGKETGTARRNQIQPKLMEALQALKLFSQNSALNLTELLPDGFHPLEDNVLKVCEILEVICNVGGGPSA